MSGAALPQDLLDWINAVFPDDEKELVIAELEGAVDHAGKPVEERLLRSAALGSRGTLKGIGDMVAMLKVDWRDVIMFGEYEVQDKKLFRIRDNTKPIPGAGELHGMNVNERLFAMGLIPEFDRGVKAGNFEAVVAVLRRTYLPEESARETAVAVLANPTKYGFH